MRAGSGGVRLQLIARGLCHVRFVPHGDVPPADRAAHLRTQLLAWQPFDVAGYALVDGEHGTTVWAWDQAAFAARADAAGLPTQPPQVLPETLVRPAHGDGVALSRCTAGVEAQVWQAGQLVASRWWPQAPDVTAWRNFQRSAGVKPEQQQPELPALPEGEPPWLDAPWAWPQTPAGMAERARLRTHAAIAVVAALLVLPTLALLHTRWQLGQSIDALEQARTELQAQALPLTAARGEAMASLATLDAIRARVEHPQALTLLAHLGQHLPADGSALRSLEWNGRQLQLELSAPAATPRITYVQEIGRASCRERV